MNAPGDAAAAPSGLSEQTRSDAKAPDARQHKRQEAAIARLRPDAIQLLIAASVYREPVDLGALLFQVGRQDWASDQQPGDVAADSGSDTAAPGPAEGDAVPPDSGLGRPVIPGAGPSGLSVLLRECATAGLLTVEPLAAGDDLPAEPADRPVAVFVARSAAIELQGYLARKRRGMEVVAAHRRAADYWLCRVSSLQQDRKADVHDLLEARHHLLAADDGRQAEAVTQSVCDQLHASGDFEQEAELTRDTLIWLPYESPHRAAWVHQLGKAAQMQGDNSAARLYRQALDLFSQLGDSSGVASVRQDLDILGQARGDTQAAGPGSQQTAEAAFGYAATIAAAPAFAATDAIRAAQDGGAEPEPVRYAFASAPQFTGREPRGAYPAISPAWGERQAGHANPAGWWRWPALVAVLIMTAGLATLVASPARPGSRAEPGRTRTLGGLTVGSAGATRRRAAIWIASQVSRNAIVACDPAMCGALQSLGMAAGSLLVLRPGASDPLGSDVVVATQAVRELFGSRLASVYAPSVLATVGSGPNRIEIRTIAPDGAAAYRTALSADVAARRQAAALLLRNPQITFSASAMKQMAAGLVDARMLITLATLAGLRPVSVIALGGAAPGESAGVPLSWAEVAPGRPAAAHRAGSSVTRGPGYGGGSFQRAVLAFLHAQLPPYLPASELVLRLADGQSVVRIDFAAPSPLGLLGELYPPVRAAARRHAHPPGNQKRQSPATEAKA